MATYYEISGLLERLRNLDDKLDTVELENWQELDAASVTGAVAALEYVLDLEEPGILGINELIEAALGHIYA